MLIFTVAISISISIKPAITRSLRHIRIRQRNVTFINMKSLVREFKPRTVSAVITVCSFSPHLQSAFEADAHTNKERRERERESKKIECRENQKTKSE